MITPCPRPADFVLLAITGRDAQDFLQRQLASDLRSLSTGGAMAACVLAANGKVLASGTLLKLEEQGFGWVLHASLAEATAAHLRRFILRSKLSISIDAARHMGWPDPAAPAFAWRDAAGRSLALSDTPAEGSPAEDAAFARAAIDTGWVDLDARLADRFLPQMLGLHRAGAIALDKGCYPGQEIVARTHYLGRIKRGLRRMQCASLPLLDQPLTDETGKAVGDWLHALADGGGWVGLAVVEHSALGVFTGTQSGPSPAQSQTISSDP